MTAGPSGATRRRAGWRSPVAGAVVTSVLGFLYLAGTVAFFVFAGQERAHRSSGVTEDLAAELGSVGAAFAFITVSMFGQAIASARARVHTGAGPRRLAVASGWLLGLAALAVVGVAALHAVQFACIVAGGLLLPVMFAWLTYGTVTRAQPGR